MKIVILSCLLLTGCVTKRQMNNFAKDAWIEGYDAGVQDGVENAEFYIIRSTSGKEIGHWFSNTEKILTARGLRKLKLK